MCALSKYNKTSNIMRHPFLSENLHSKSINIPCTTKVAFSDSASLLVCIHVINESDKSRINVPEMWPGRRYMYVRSDSCYTDPCVGGGSDNHVTSTIDNSLTWNKTTMCHTG